MAAVEVLEDGAIRLRRDPVEASDLVVRAPRALRDMQTVLLENCLVGEALLGLQAVGGTSGADGVRARGGADGGPTPLDRRGRDLEAGAGDPKRAEIGVVAAGAAE